MSILDRFFIEMARQNAKLNKEDLHLYGLTAIYIASKLEDVAPLVLAKLVKEAGHEKFTINEIKRAELRVFKTLEFRFSQETLLDVACRKFQTYLYLNLQLED